MKDRPSADQIFSAAIEIGDPNERQAYLDRACAQDEALRQEVESLLMADAQASQFLEQPATVMAELSGLTGPATVLAERSGEQIGRYKLLEKIGEGGFGDVWLAEQEQPVRRRVALKIIKLGMDTREVIARFEAERQALALMDHPNIARVFDGGATDSGRPYFVMELVRGEPITKYCDEQQLSLPERLELLVQVCQAVQHAHQKGVIHRDLKPSNILISIHDDRPVPKVIDFGIAKATQQRLTEKTLFTRFNQFVGTPAYMSPEQAGLSSLDVDTRSDIYSLGVLLYELLTGRTPFAKEELLAGGFEQICRTIREKEPPKPSTRLSTLTDAERSTIAIQRKVPPEKLRRLVHGDLDWIVMKCLEKDRSRRYETANGLVMDLRRYLSQEPITARPPSTVYKLQKLVRRNKLAIATGSLVTLSLIAGLGVATWTFFREREANQRALAGERQAQAEARKSQEVARFLKDMLAGVGPSVAQGRDTVLLKEILDKTAERIGQELQNQPEVEAELRASLGEVYSQISEFGKAEDMFRIVLDLRKRLHGSEHREVADALSELGSTLYHTGKKVEGEQLLRQAVAMGKKLLPSDDPDLARYLGELGFMLGGETTKDAAEGKYSEAEDLLRQALAIQQKRGKDDLELADALHSLAVIVWGNNKPAEAEVYQRKAYEIFRRIKGDVSVEVAHSFNNLGAMLQNQGKIPQAEDMHRQALTLRKRLLPPNHMEVAQSLNNLAGLLRRQGKLDDAEPLVRESVQIHRTLGEHPRLVWALDSLGGFLNEREQFSEAESLLREAVNLGVRILGHQDPWVRAAVQNLVTVLASQGKDDDVERLVAQALESTPETSAAHADALAARGSCRARSSRWKEAITDYAKAAEIRPQNHGFYQFLAPLLVQVGDRDGYETNCAFELKTFGGTNNPIVAGRVAKDCLILPLRGAGIDIIRKWSDMAVAAGTNHWHWAYAAAVKGLAEYRQQNFAGAVEWSEKALAEIGKNHRRDVQACMVLAMAQHHLGQLPEARKAFARGEEIAAATLPEPNSKDLGPDWGNWIVAQVLMKEAKELFEGQLTTREQQ